MGGTGAYEHVKGNTGVDPAMLYRCMISSDGVCVIWGIREKLSILAIGPFLYLHARCLKCTLDQDLDPGCSRGHHQLEHSACVQHLYRAILRSDASST